MRRVLVMLFLVVVGVGVMAVGAPALGPAPSWELSQGAANTCVVAGSFGLPGVETNIPVGQASEQGVLSAPGYPALGETHDSAFGPHVGSISFTVFANAPYSLPAHTPLTLSVTTYYGTNFTGGVAYVSTVTWDCTTGEWNPGHIIVRKVVAPGAPAATFSFQRSWGADFSLAAGGSVASGELAPGVYSVAEVLGLGWSLESAVCDDGSSPAAIGVSDGETVTCTFTNAYRLPVCFGRAATMVGTAGPDNLVGTAGADVILGMGGDDTISGLGGDDRICGGGGADVLLGGDGNDRLRGAGGDDRLEGGPGADILKGKLGDDVLIGGDGADVGHGGGGSDSCDTEGSFACE